MNLYHVQDSDRPMYVLAENWAGAIAKWQCKVAEENGEDASDTDQPAGIALVAEQDDLIT